mmetsp:Transcript_26170/g.98518  ORF Transcript_26170/g.98518 Transcript_26170/m.98518 type:complete len:215 (+) Transcript_26170:364-1008(+)
MTAAAEGVSLCPGEEVALAAPPAPVAMGGGDGIRALADTATGRAAVALWTAPGRGSRAPNSAGCARYRAASRIRSSGSPGGGIVSIGGAPCDRTRSVRVSHRAGSKGSATTGPSGSGVASCIAAPVVLRRAWRALVVLGEPGELNIGVCSRSHGCSTISAAERRRSGSFTMRRLIRSRAGALIASHSCWSKSQMALRARCLMVSTGRPPSGSKG